MSALGRVPCSPHIATMTTIYIDESGFTGDDLYNSEQRYFVIASTAIGDNEARAVLRRCFPQYQGAEFKFTNIWRRRTHRNGLRALAKEIPALADRMFVYLIDKRFSLLIKIFDYLVEPAAYHAGYDWYADGWGMRYMNQIHYDILRHGSEGLYDGTVRLWDNFARSPGPTTLDAFQDHLEQIVAASRPPLSSLFDLPRLGIKNFRSANPRLETFTDSNEIQVTSVFSTMAWWRQQRTEDFHLMHDESSAFLKRGSMWNAMLRDDIPPQRIPTSNGSDIELPIRIRSTMATSSKASPAIQLCDVLAGFAAKAAPGLYGQASDPFVRELIDLGAGELVHSGVMPHPLFPEGKPNRRTGPDMVDRMLRCSNRTSSVWLRIASNQTRLKSAIVLRAS